MLLAVIIYLPFKRLSRYWLCTREKKSACCYSWLSQAGHSKRDWRGEEMWLVGEWNIWIIKVGMRRKSWVSSCLFSVEEGKSRIKFHQEPSPWYNRAGWLGVKHQVTYHQEPLEEDGFPWHWSWLHFCSRLASSAGIISRKRLWHLDGRVLPELLQLHLKRIGISSLHACD